MRIIRLIIIVLFGIPIAWSTAAESKVDPSADTSPKTSADKETEIEWGHSHLGSVYDEGPRSKPWKMEGIGETHFPVTTTHPEVQSWFDQGHTLLHGFWPFEAERSFRWCIKLDPDCAMAYWGLSRCCEMDDERAAKFMNEAIKRKAQVSPRERAYLELWVAKANVKKARMAAKKAGEDDEKTDKTLKKALEDYAVQFDKLLMNYPDDMEARALYWLELPRTLNENEQEGFSPNRYGMERVLQEVLTKSPDHVGALHYRIHNWDSREGEYALDSCLKLSEVAPNAGHLQHMPGHVLSGIGLWHEAAIAMDTATRVEKAYMHQRMIQPDQNWNYAHNLDYLCYIQEQLGMFDAAMTGVEQLVAGPRSAKKGMAAIGNFLDKFSAVRLLVKAERWDQILDSDNKLITWDPKNPMDQFLSGYIRTHALIGVGKLDDAEKELQKLREPPSGKPNGAPSGAKPAGPSAGKPNDGNNKPPSAIPPGIMDKVLAKTVRLQELEGKLRLAQGKHLEGVGLLSEAAEAQAENWSNDPPPHPMYLYNTLGDAYLELGSAQLAIEAYQKTLDTIKNDGFALSGLVRAHAELGEIEKAQTALAKLKSVWSDADRPNRRLELAIATGIEADASLDAPIAERNYKREVLDKNGSSLWAAASAPPFTANDSSGEIVQLNDYAAKNVVLIFYQGGECLHCMEQMQEINKRVNAFEKLETVIVAISQDDRETIQSYEGDLDVRLLSDPDLAISKAYRSFDDFEEIELHSTVLIDKLGRVHWSQNGGDPFMDFDFLESEIKRLNGLQGEAKK